jgi:hypothetical protein
MLIVNINRHCVLSIGRTLEEIAIVPENVVAYKALTTVVVSVSRDLRISKLVPLEVKRVKRSSLRRVFTNIESI